LRAMAFLAGAVAVAWAWLGAGAPAAAADAAHSAALTSPAPFAIVFAAAALGVFAAVPLVRLFSLRTGVGLDRPNERKMHTAPMPRLGGVAIFFGVTCALLLVWGLGWFGILPPVKEYEIWGVTIGAVLFFGLGLADDLSAPKGLPAAVRLVVQFAVAVAAWKVGVDVAAISLPGMGVVKLAWLGLPLTAIWLVGVVNAVNFIDGLDGLAAGVAGIAATVTFCVAIFTGQWAAALISAAVAGGTLGFLPYNFHRARIFMGDGGAYFLGFMLAGLAVIGVVKSTLALTVALVIPFCILAVPIFDTASVIVQRLRRGVSPFKADKRHLHHKLMGAGLSHRSTVLVIYALTLWAGSLALAISGMPAGGTYAALATLLLGYVAWGAWKKSQESRP